MNPRMIEEMGWRMAEVYASVSDRLLVNLARHFQYLKTTGNLPTSFSYQTRLLAEMGLVTQESIQIIAESLGGADDVLKQLLEETIKESLKDVDPQLRKAAEKGLLHQPMQELAPNQMQAFRAFYDQSADKLNLVNTTMLESTQNLYRDTVSNISAKISLTQGVLNQEAGQVVSGVSTLNQAIRDGVQRMVEIGITGFIDSGGHHWSPEAYVNMDIRTTLANTGRAAVWEQMDEYGDDLYMVSYHDGARPLCYPWQGKVISRTNQSREVEDLDGNKVHVYAQSETTYGEAAGLFGINCGHYPMPFIPGLSIVRKPTQNEEENKKEYEESQEQRRLERRLREEKRDIAVLKAQGASADEIKAQRLKVENARDNLDAFCEQTGRARRSGRESTPIKATWPDGYEPPKTPTPNYIPQTQTVPITPAAPVTPVSPSTDYLPYTGDPQSKVEERLLKIGVDQVPVRRNAATLAEDQIIETLSGADKTGGSCASLCFAYTGQQGGLDVHDFRGGMSRTTFSQFSNIAEIARLDGVSSTFARGYNDFNNVHNLLTNVQEGKRYILTAGRHAAIVRKSQTGYDYLEMQSGYRKNTWYALNDGELKRRFGCQKSHTTFGMKFESSECLIDVDSLKNNDAFHRLLRFINTAVDKQMKGIGGGEK